MRKIYKFNGEGFDEAWIGKTAPVPDGWYLDASSAREVKDPIKKSKAKAGGDLSDMSKDELEAFAQDRWGIDIDKRKRHDALVDEVQGYLEAEYRP